MVSVAVHTEEVRSGRSRLRPHKIANSTAKPEFVVGLLNRLSLSAPTQKLVWFIHAHSARLSTACKITLEFKGGHAVYGALR